MLRTELCTTSQDAANLLLRVREIAFDELLSKSTAIETEHCFIDYTHQQLYCDIMHDTIYADETHLSGIYSLDDDSPSIRRSRTISLCSSSEVDTDTRKDVFVDESNTEEYPKPNISSHQRTSFYLNASEKHGDESRSVSPNILVQSKLSQCETDAAETPTISLSCTKYTDIQLDFKERNVREVLRKKFSWKSFPELERYLIDHRSQYLQYSNQLNYTAEQKRYNNRLTQGLLDLAAVEGYLFEDFTFAAVRDRIRCYYKSYVQATKKKKLKMKRSFSKS